MMQVLLAIEIVVAIFLVATILMQRSEGGALGMGGGGGIGGLMSARGAGDLLTRATSVLAALFIGLSLALAVLAGNRGDGTSVFDDRSSNNPAAVEETADDLQQFDMPLSDPEAADETLADPEEETPAEDGADE